MNVIKYGGSLYYNAPSLGLCTKGKFSGEALLTIVGRLHDL